MSKDTKSKSLKKLIDIDRLKEFKNKLVGTGSAYVQTAAVDQTIAGTKTFSKPIVGSVTGSSGSCTGNAATATKLATARTIALSGAATGTATSFDGSGNITIPVTALASSAIRAHILSMVYPVGSVYISVNDVSPAAFLGGTWEKISQGRVLQGAANGQVAGTAVEAGLPAAYMPDGVFESIGLMNDNWTNQYTRGCFGVGIRAGFAYGSGSVQGSDWQLGSYAYSFIDRTITGDCYGKSNTVQPPALLVNIWKRTA